MRGGQFANIVGTEVLSGTLTDSQNFDIAANVPAGVNPTAVRITIGANDADDNQTNGGRDQDHFQASLTLDLINNTYSGTVLDFSFGNTGKFTFGGQTIGVNAITAPIVQGDISGDARDVTVSINAGIISVIFTETTTTATAGAEQASYLVEYLDASNSSLDFLSTDGIASDFLDQNPENTRTTVSVPVSDNPDVIVVTAALGDVLGQAQEEQRGSVRIVLQEQAGSYVATGVVTYTGRDNGGSGNLTYAFENYIVGTDPATAVTLISLAVPDSDLTISLCAVWQMLPPCRLLIKQQHKI